MRPDGSGHPIGSQSVPQQAPDDEWDAWLEECRALARDILARRGGQPLEINKWLQADRADLEARDEHALGHRAAELPGEEPNR